MAAVLFTLFRKNYLYKGCLSLQYVRGASVAPNSQIPASNNVSFLTLKKTSQKRPCNSHVLLLTSYLGLISLLCPLIRHAATLSYQTDL